MKPLQIQNLKRKKWGDMAYYVPQSEKVGDTSPVSPTKLRPWLQEKLQGYFLLQQNEAYMLISTTLLV